MILKPVNLKTGKERWGGGVAERASVEAHEKFERWQLERALPRAGPAPPCPATHHVMVESSKRR